ncbi:LysE family translocator [Neisseria sp. 83E34]|uniref:LysE family translocator n=1 Tax=Neisseria sp. 83E34 TaxID=1692264 RepID=UPI0006CE8F52|nr:LysE family translocator [Neisseria sp. 83E34]KPN72316.1 hypothetical protein AKG09_00185 [Neisseria sp. 83E34]
MNYPLYITYLATIFLLIATPGPVVGYMVHTSYRYGWKKAVLAAIGTNAASLGLIVFAALIIFGTFAINPFIFNLVSLAGSLFLALLAIRMFKETRNVSRKLQTTPNSTSVVLNAFAIGISNPKDIIFCVAFFPQFMKIMPQPEQSLGILVFSWIVCDFLILCTYIFIANHKLIVTRMRRLSLLSALVIFVIGVMGVVYSIGSFLQL